MAWGEFVKLLSAAALAAVVVVAAAPASAQNSVSNLRDKLMQISPGTSGAAVLAALGTPGDRSFFGAGEAWQYCEQFPFRPNMFATVWLLNGVVVGLTTESSTVPQLCYLNFPETDWGQAPTEVRIQIR